MNKCIVFFWCSTNLYELFTLFPLFVHPLTPTHHWSSYWLMEFLRVKNSPVDHIEKLWKLAESEIIHTVNIIFRILKTYKLLLEKKVCWQFIVIFRLLLVVLCRCCSPIILMKSYCIFALHCSTGILLVKHNHIL